MMTTESKDFLRRSTRLRRLRDSEMKDSIFLKIKRRLLRLSPTFRTSPRSLRTVRITSSLSLRRPRKKSKTSKLRR